MKTLNSFFSVLLLTGLIAACSSSTGPGDGPQRIGTWRIDSGSHATWLGSQAAQSVKAFYVLADSTEPDTTYFFSNDSLQVTITENTVNPGGDFEFRIDAEGLHGEDLYDAGFKTIIAANLNDAFEVVDYSGSTFEYDPDIAHFIVTTTFNCSSVDNMQEDLLIAFTSYTDVDPNTNNPDTLFYYQIDTDGMYEVVRNITCPN